MKTVLKTYEISYILGSINPEEKKIKISTTNQLTDAFIISEIERQRPNHKGYITNVLSQVLINEKVIAEEKEERVKEDTNIPIFNW